MTVQRIERFRANLPPTQRNQCESLMAVSEIRRRFHAPIPNNYSLILLPQSVTPAHFVGTLAQGAEVLNAFNVNVHIWVTQRVELASAGANHFILPTLVTLLSHWADCIERGNHFLCVDYAEKVCQGLSMLRSVHEPVAPYSVTSHALDVADDFKASLRLDVAVPHIEVPQLLFSLLGATLNRLMVNDFIDRVEIAKVIRDPKENPDYPTLSMFFKPSAALQHDLTAELTELTNDVRRFLLTTECGTRLNKPFTVALHPAISIGQGFSLYKRYLHLFNLLGHVYSTRYNFAFLNRNHRLSFEAMAESLLSTLGVVPVYHNSQSATSSS